MEFCFRFRLLDPINIFHRSLAGRCILVYSSSRYASLLDKENRRLRWSTHVKDKKSDAERLATAKEYEERRRRGFKASWP